VKTSRNIAWAGTTNRLSCLNLRSCYKENCRHEACEGFIPAL